MLAIPPEAGPAQLVPRPGDSPLILPELPLVPPELGEVVDGTVSLPDVEALGALE